MDNQDIGTLALRDWQNLPRPMRVVGVNVAGEATRVRVEAQLMRWRIDAGMADRDRRGLRRQQSLRVAFAARARIAGRRWSLRATRALQALFPAPCVVVTARTVISVDALDGEGVFRGGVVIPGINLMLQALASNTSHEDCRRAATRIFRSTTRTRMIPASVQAVCGAIEQMRGRLAATPARNASSGGAAAEIAPHLTAPVEVVDNLVLEGVLALALTQ